MIKVSFSLALRALFSLDFVFNTFFAPMHWYLLSCHIHLPNAYFFALQVNKLHFILVIHLIAPRSALVIIIVVVYIKKRLSECQYVAHDSALSLLKMHTNECIHNLKYECVRLWGCGNTIQLVCRSQRHCQQIPWTHPHSLADP